MPKFDVNEIKRENPLSEVLPRRFGVKLAKNGAEWKACCPLHTGDNDPSFTVFRARTGNERFQCFGCGAQGDIIDFVQEHQGVDYNAACEILGGRREIATTSRPAEPVEGFDPYKGYRAKWPPANAPEIIPGKETPSLLNPKRLTYDGKPRSVTYKPSRVHAYRDEAGQLRHYVLRVDIGNGKKITPAIIWYENKETRFAGWSHGVIPEPRKLYGLEDLKYAKANTQRLIVEGEKCRDEFLRLSIKGMVPLSWSGGGKSYQKTDWSPLNSAKAVFWPDNDDEGERTMLGFWTPAGVWKPGIIELAFEAGLKEAKYIQPPGSDKPKGWDVADAIEKDKWTAEQVITFMRGRAVTITMTEIRARKHETKAAVSDPKQDRQQREPAREARTVEQAKPKADRDESDDRQAATQEPDTRENVTAIHGHKIPDPTEHDDWHRRILFNAEGMMKPKAMQNFITYLTSYPECRGLFGSNEFDGMIYLMRKPPWDNKPVAGEWKPRPMADADYISATGYLERHHLSPKPNETGQAVIVAAQAMRFNPVVEYLTSLKWDGKPRLCGGRTQDGDDFEPWLTEYMDAENTVINRAFGMRWMIAAVARAMEPGCKVDNMLILEGPQGKRKSMVFETLGKIAGTSYYNGNMGDIDSKDAVLVMQSVWIIEEAELNMMDRKSANHVKNWMTRASDRIRKPYGKTTENFPRHTIFAGTVNPSGMGYLKDPTGARRFWPVAIGIADIERLSQDKDQLWAEAVHLYRKGLQWWLTPEEDEMAKEVQADRTEQEPWDHAIDHYVAGMKQCTIADILKNALAIPVERHTAFYQKRVADHLHKSGWIRRKIRTELEYNPKWGFVRP